ncbi:hypothetical protein [Catenuloplanes japonicus]|uniref:hypothetical protein n=1 Tax=Catenuloplanes japonicus TaxID=33876 RepID=UPI0012FB8B24|nr:hypothetical protein [Catenuloplanes japonicus]
MPLAFSSLRLPQVGLTWVSRRTLRLAGAFALFVLAFTGGWTSTTSDAPPATRIVSATSAGGIDLVPAGADRSGITPAGSAVDVVQAPAAGDRQPALPGTLPLLAVAAFLLATLPECRRPLARSAPSGPRGDRAPPLRHA